MTFRGVLLGLLGAAIICGFSYFNDNVMRQTNLIGNYMPIAIFGSLLLFVMLVNPLLHRIKPWLALSGRELAVALALMLAACCIPGSGFLRSFNTTLMLPFHLQRTTPAWQQADIVNKVPPIMLAEVNKQNEETALNGFVQGMREGEKNISFSQIPWSAWRRTLTFWLPLVLIFWIGLLGLSLVLHRQWADHEQLPYPIAAFTNALLPQGKQMVVELFRNRLFWIGALPVMFIHLNNYACKWFPDLIPTSTKLIFKGHGIEELVPTLMLGGGWWVFEPTFFFTLIAFTYFLRADVSLSLGIGPVLWMLMMGTLFKYSIAPSLMIGTPVSIFAQAIAFGAYIGTLLAIIYTGRKFYTGVFRRALLIPTSETPARESVWGGRIFLLAMTLFIVYICVFTHVAWPVALAYTLCTVVIYVIISRMVAETGIIFILSYIYPHTIIFALFGYQALGLQTMLVLMLLTVALAVEPREAFMPYIMNSLKVLDLQRVKTAKFAGWAVAALLIGLSVAMPVMLYLQYNYGANRTDATATQYVPGLAFNNAVLISQKMEAQGKALPVATSGLESITKIAPDGLVFVPLVIGVLLVVLFTIARFRLTKWPLHPVMFLLWHTYPGRICFPSFLVGWFVKSAVLRFGGNRLYNTLKPMMFGLIAGELLAGIITIVIGLVYYALTKQQPMQFNIMPY